MREYEIDWYKVSVDVNGLLFASRPDRLIHGLCPALAEYYGELCLQSLTFTHKCDVTCVVVCGVGPREATQIVVCSCIGIEIIR